MAHRYRRVVTGEDKHGKSLVVRDNPVSPTDVRSVHWFTQRTADALRDPPELALGNLPLNPPSGATTFQIITIPPEDHEYTPERLERFYAAALAGSTAVRGDTSRHPGMHRTPTIDYVIVLDGELTMILSEQEVVLKPFDTIVQRGTEHAWTNRGETPAVFSVVTVDLSVAGVAPVSESRAVEFAALFALTPAETELALALARGQRLYDFAAARSVSRNTVRTHAARLRQKLGVASISDIVRMVLLHVGPLI